MTTTLLLARHGETVDNANKIMQGQTPGRLNEHGIEQAEQLAKQLQTVRIDVFVSSDLKRSFDTCAIVAESKGEAPENIVQTPLLRERDWGSFTGRYIPDLKNEPWTDDIETIEHMKERAQLFLKHIKAQYNGKTILAVGHGIINKAIQSVFYNKPMAEIEKMENAEVRTLVL